MLKSFIRITTLGLLSLAIAGLPFSAAAEGTNKASTKGEAEKGEVTKKAVAGPFHGKLAAMDKTAKTITVGKRTFHITSETKFVKAGKPATFDEGVVGEEVSGYVKPNEEGKLVATKVNYGPKAETKRNEEAAPAAKK